eukprot:scaffold17682_cov113-Isochrysis_galbana.AAC.9
MKVAMPLSRQYDECECASLAYITHEWSNQITSPRTRARANTSSIEPNRVPLRGRACAVAARHSGSRPGAGCRRQHYCTTTRKMH